MAMLTLTVNIISNLRSEKSASTTSYDILSTILMSDMTVATTDTCRNLIKSEGGIEISLLLNIVSIEQNVHNGTGSD